LRAHFLAQLRSIAGVTEPSVVESMFREWSPRIELLARYIENSPPSEPRQAQLVADRVVDLALGLQRDDLGVVELLELRRIKEEFLRSQDIETYALETSLVRLETDLVRRLTPIGTVFLQLRGKDAVRWLLTAEVLQSTGDLDPWRTSRALMEAALSRVGIPMAFGGGDPAFRFDRRLLMRLEEMGVLVGVMDNFEVDMYRAAADWIDVVRGILGSGPWHHAIAAILEDDRAKLVSHGKNAAEVVVEQAKTIAHEVRNALVPVRHHLDALRGAATAAQAGRIEAAKRGVVRVLAFVDEMVATSELIAEAAAPHDPTALIREALGWIEGSERVVVIGEPDVRVLVPRSQMTRALSNMLRNALQATEDKQPVQFRVVRAGGFIRLVVDDGGSGVPADARERVFQEGYTTRTEGSGYGLSYVRRVADALHGRVWCESSDLGGARFVIELPDVNGNQ
jgi:signal transduction histidine kinase